MTTRAAQRLLTGGGRGGSAESRQELLEIAEVVVIAIVTIATAWSVYQAARWDGRQTLRYGESSRARFQADASSTLGGQSLVADSAGFNSWLEAHAAGDRQLERIFEGRFTSEYRVAFDAWLRTDPFHDPDAPPGPAHMPEYHNAQMEAAAKLNTTASDLFDQGTAARETASRYVRDTVLFASVLFLVAVGQRFTVRRVRIAADAVAAVLLIWTVIGVIALPRI